MLYLVDLIVLAVAVIQFGSACEVLKTGELSPEQINIILKKHNDLRSKIATGGEEGLPQASGMMELVWDEKLAQTALNHAQKCVFEHDTSDCDEAGIECGQNLYSGGSTKSEIPEANWEKAIQLWYDEVSDFDKSGLGSFNAKSAGHFTQLIWATTTKVGCGFAVYKDGKYTKQLITCNYAPPGNVMTAAIYNEGQPCSDCPEGTMCSSTYNGLCVQNQTGGQSDQPQPDPQNQPLQPQPSPPSAPLEPQPAPEPSPPNQPLEPQPVPEPSPPSPPLQPQPVLEPSPPNQPLEPQPVPEANQPTMPSQPQPVPGHHTPDQPTTPSQPQPVPGQHTPDQSIQLQPSTPNQPLELPPVPSQDAPDLPLQPQPVPEPNQPNMPLEPQPLPSQNTPNQSLQPQPNPPHQPSQPHPVPGQDTPELPLQPQPVPDPHPPSTPLQPQPVPEPSPPSTPLQPQPVPEPNPPSTPLQPQPVPEPNPPSTPWQPQPAPNQNTQNQPTQPQSNSPYQPLQTQPVPGQDTPDQPLLPQPVLEASPPNQHMETQLIDESPYEMTINKIAGSIKKMIDFIRQNKENKDKYNDSGHITPPGSDSSSYPNNRDDSVRPEYISDLLNDANVKNRDDIWEELQHGIKELVKNILSGVMQADAGQAHPSSNTMPPMSESNLLQPQPVPGQNTPDQKLQPQPVPGQDTPHQPLQPQPVLEPSPPNQHMETQLIDESPYEMTINKIASSIKKLIDSITKNKENKDKYNDSGHITPPGSDSSSYPNSRDDSVRPEYISDQLNGANAKNPEDLRDELQHGIKELMKNILSGVMQADAGQAHPSSNTMLPMSESNLVQPQPVPGQHTPDQPLQPQPVPGQDTSDQPLHPQPVPGQHTPDQPLQPQPVPGRDTPDQPLQPQPVSEPSPPNQHMETQLIDKSPYEMTINKIANSIKKMIDFITKNKENKDKYNDSGHITPLGSDSSSYPNNGDDSVCPEYFSDQLNGANVKNPEDIREELQHGIKELMKNILSGVMQADAGPAHPSSNTMPPIAESNVMMNPDTSQSDFGHTNPYWHMITHKLHPGFVEPNIRQYDIDPSNPFSFMMRPMWYPGPTDPFMPMEPSAIFSEPASECPCNQDRFENDYQLQQYYPVPASHCHPH